MTRTAAHIAAATLCLSGILAAPALAQAPDQLNPPQLQGVDIVEHLGETLPLELSFKDEQGESVKLGEFFKGERPVIITLVYYNCPMLCGLLLNGFNDGLGSIPYVPGKDFDIVTVSIDPREGPELARQKKKVHLDKLGKPGADRGWHFLTGDRENIKALADAIGFQYYYDNKRMEYAHGAAIFFASPKGKLTRYLYGIQFPEKQLRLAITEAGEGTVGTVVDRFLLRCYHYESDSQKYGVYVWGVMRMGGALTVLMIATLLIVMWRRERRRGDAEVAASAVRNATRA